MGSVSWVKKTAFPILFGIEKNKLVVNQIYKAMDKLNERMDEVQENFFHNNKKAKMLCGYYILETTKTEMPDKEIEEHCKELKFVEESFSAIKRYSRNNAALSLEGKESKDTHIKN